MINSLFDFPFYKTKIDPSEYDKEKIVSRSLENYKKNTYRNNWDTYSNIHHSFFDENNSDFDAIDYSSILPLYKSKFNSFLETLKLPKNEKKWTVTIDNYTVTTGDQFMRSHRHLPAVFNGVHYIKFDKEKHKSAVFENPCPIISDVRLFENFIEDYSSKNCNWVLPSTTIDIEENDFIIVPATIKHYVPQSFWVDERISISCNMYYIGNQFKTDNQSELVYN